MIEKQVKKQQEQMPEDYLIKALQAHTQFKAYSYDQVSEILQKFNEVLKKDSGSTGDFWLLNSDQLFNLITYLISTASSAQ